MSSFILNGHRYRLSREDLERKLKGVVPKAPRKYGVDINGSIYPPKQVLAEVLELPLVTFTTMDASRALGALGLEVKHVETGEQPLNRTLSEEVFEQYLEENGHPDVEFEPVINGTNKRPDYRLRLSAGGAVLFDVKEFRGTKDDFRSGFGSFDPYIAIREKIEAGRKKFKDLSDHCCGLVLHNVDKPLVDLDWFIVFGAMLGNLAWSVPIHPGADSSVGFDAETVFTSGGKMHRHSAGKPAAPQNTTISAVIALRNFNLGQRRLAIRRRDVERHLGRRLTLEEHWELIEKARGTDADASLFQTRVVVHHNPYARVSFPPGLFAGPYDERYGDSGSGQVGRLFVGDELKALEALASEAT